ncbi:MAG: helix-turn-helix transcriptional regulator [Chloroflexi bacterium]|nr:helix-turn-helix transcriptional regulator [Chloroflexota bacterium]
MASTGERYETLMTGNFTRYELLLLELFRRRQRAGLTQRELASVMRTSQSVVAHLEASDVDPRVSTLLKYASALGQELHWSLPHPAISESRAEEVSDTVSQSAGSLTVPVVARPKMAEAGAAISTSAYTPAVPDLGQTAISSALPNPRQTRKGGNEYPIVAA